MITVRMASLDDVKGIVNVHCSDVDRWVKHIDGKEVEAEYEDLTIEERFAHGGPWMSAETCAIHLNYLIVHSQYPIVAELNGKIVGELELYIGEERSILGKCAFIDIIEVHKDYRCKGIGRALIGKAFEIAKKHNCDTIAVWHTKEDVEFYRKCGIEEVAYNIVYLEFDIRKIEFKKTYSYEISAFPEKYSTVKELVFVSPRILSSFTAWLKSRWSYAIEETRAIRNEGYVPKLQAAYIVENIWSRRDVANLLLWLRSIEYLPLTINVIFKITGDLGFNKLRLYVDKKIYERYLKKYEPKILSSELVLMSRI